MYTFEDTEGGVFVRGINSWASLDFYLQPILSTSSKQARFYEVLSRVNSQSGEDYNSEDFFSNIEDDFIKQLVVRQIKRMYECNIPLKFSVNCTLSCFSDNVFVEKLLALDVSRFAIEINDINADIHNSDIQEGISSIIKAGGAFWLDDYYHKNTNFNSTLGVIEWDIIKIDKQYLHHNYSDKKLLDAMIIVLSSFAKNGVIFEGVETRLQHELLSKHDIMVQGFLYNAPEPFSDIILDKETIVI